MSSRVDCKTALLGAVLIFISVYAPILNAEVSIQYTYDDLNRLERVNYGHGTIIQYIYDEVGNRDRKIISMTTEINVNPWSVNFGIVDVGNYPDTIITVVNLGGVDLAIGTVTHPSAPFSMLSDLCSGVVLPTSATCKIRIRFQPSGQGQFSDSISIPSNDSWSPVIIPIQGTGNIPCLGAVRVVSGSTVYFSSLQAAYNAAGSGDTIQSQAVQFTEDLNLNRNISVTLEGGYDCSYSSITGLTTVEGNVTVSDGFISSIENYEIQNIGGAPLSAPSGGEFLSLSNGAEISSPAIPRIVIPTHATSTPPIQ